MKGIIAILIFSFLLLSCASAGREIDTSALQDKIKLNESTKEDVLKLFGEPLFKNVDQKDGTEMWHYASVKKNITATGILANRLGIGSEWRTNTQVVDFYFQKGILVNITDNNSDTTTFHLQ
jgi:hypothetical protein